MDGWVGERAGLEVVGRATAARQPARLIGRSESPVRFPIRLAPSPPRSTNVGSGSRSTKCCGASIGGVALEGYMLRRERERERMATVIRHLFVEEPRKTPIAIR